MKIEHPDDFAKVGRVFTGDDARADDKSSGLRLTRVADVEARPVEWLWPGRLALGKLTLLGGNPGTGKSTILYDASARITKGIPWPDGTRAPLGSVIVLSAEDAIGDTIRPRLEAAGADLNRVHVIEAVTGSNGTDRTFSLQEDLTRLRNAVAQVGDVVLVTLDPITSYMGGSVDSHRTTDVRAILEPFARFAEEMRVAGLAVTHPPKAAQGRAINSFTGSLAFVAAARMAFITIEEPETERRLLLPVKNNLAAMPAGLGYGIEQIDLPSGIGASRVVWDGQPVTVTAGEAIKAVEGGTSKDKVKEAKTFLREQLAAGPVAVNEVFRIAEEWEIAEKTLRRAADKLGVVKEKASFQGGWTWALPDREAS